MIRLLSDTLTKTDNDEQKNARELRIARFLMASHLAATA